MMYYIALGSNIGDRLKNLQAAKNKLEQIGSIFKQSSVYESEPWGNRNQNNFYNALVTLNSEMRPFRLLRKLKIMEVQMGRVRASRWGPRLIDLDIIAWNGPAIFSAILTIPHPYLEKRDFVLRPLLDVNEQFILPSGKAINEVASEPFSDNQLKKITVNW